jgi:hypothetical protein
LAGRTALSIRISYYLPRKKTIWIPRNSRLWYGELYVVVEGWKELDLSDPTVDSLLQSSNVELLRRYRNGVFHFQREYFDERFLGLIRDGQDAAAWVLDLNQSFSAFFLNKFREWKEAKAIDG